MDIKKPVSAIQSSPPTLGARQTADSNTQSNNQPDILDLKANFSSQVKIGQQLELLVIKLTDYDAILEIVGTKTQVQTEDNDLLQLGQRLKAQITSTEPMLQLKVLTPDIEHNNKLQALINSVLRQIMPGQQPIKNLLDNIQLLNQLELPKNSALQTVKDAFVQSLPPAQAFETAEVLPEILKRSGMFTEHQLQKIITESSHNFPNNDLKIALLRLADKLRNLNSTTSNPIKPDLKNIPTETTATNPNLVSTAETYSLTSIQQNSKPNADGSQQQPETAQNQTNTANTKPVSVIYTQEQLVEKLLSHTEGALSRLQTLQLQHLQHHETQKPSWFFELPMRADNALDHINIHIEQDASGNKTNSYTVPWKVILEFNIKELGAIQAHVLLQGNKVSVNFWIENDSTSTLFADHLNLLDTRLNKAGLTTGKLNCHCDKAPPLPKPLHSQLINETL